MSETESRVLGSHLAAALYLRERAERVAGQSNEVLLNERWHSRNFVSRFDLFQAKLASLGIASEIAAECVETWQDSPPLWSDDIHDWLGAADSPIGLLEPFVRGARLQLESARTLLSVPTEKDAVEIALAHIAESLGRILSRTLILEVNIARITGQLKATTPEARFQEFRESLRAPGRARAFLQEYPVLARSLWNATRQKIASTCELWSRLSLCYSELALFLGVRDLGVWTDYKGGLGDSHRDGRSVSILTFSSGVSVAYKPRSLAVDREFGHFVEWMNGHGFDPTLTHPKVFDRGTYGWQQFVAPAGCHDRSAITRYFERVGGLLAILYSFDSNDFHYENVIACGEHPMLVDLETLFHPPLPLSSGGHQVFEFLSGLAQSSLLRVGLLPNRIITSENAVGTDLSGLGGTEGQMSPTRVAAVEDQGKDTVHVAQRHAVLPGAGNRVFLNGEPIYAADFTDSVIAGYERAFRIICREKKSLSTGAVLDGFSSVETRTIIRPTAEYWRLLQDSYHPNMLNCGMQRESVFDVLWSEGNNGATPPNGVLRSELDDLLNGDVPYFAGRPSSSSIWNCNGAEISDIYPEPPLDSVKKRISLMFPDQLDRDRWLIRCSMSTSPSAKKSEPLVNPCTPPESQKIPSQDELLSEAVAVGDRLLAMSQRKGRYIGWLTLLTADGQSWSCGPTTTDLYSGLTGIGVFLSTLGVMSGSERFLAAGEACINTTVECIEAVARHLGPGRLKLGCWTGDSGVAYTMGLLSKVLKNEALHERALRVISDIAVDYGTAPIDVMSGIAGHIGVLVALHKSEPSVSFRNEIEKLAETIVRRAVTEGENCYWNESWNGGRPVTGYAHGGTGIALNLARAAKLLDRQDLLMVARRALLFEDKHFSLDSRAGWHDLRNLSSDERPSWCYGASGIGYGRLVSPDPLAKQMLATAADLTMKYGFSRSSCLCHGDLGNLAFLLRAEESMPEIGTQTRSVEAEVLRRTKSCGSPTGSSMACRTNRNRIDVPGFMVGWAGIGYYLLRAAFPAIPCLLMTEAWEKQPVQPEEEEVCSFVTE